MGLIRLLAYRKCFSSSGEVPLLLLLSTISKVCCYPVASVPFGLRSKARAALLQDIPDGIPVLTILMPLI